MYEIRPHKTILSYVYNEKMNGSSAFRYVVGVDEVGRGPIAGPLAVCALKVDRNFSRILGEIKDSKKLSAAARERWFGRIMALAAEGAVSYALSFISVFSLDKIGMRAALRLAVSRALGRLRLPPAESLVLLDGGLSAPRRFIYQETVVKGDETIPVIALASIVAKVRRDRRMAAVAKRYPLYGFERHKGYGTKEHYARISLHGICPIHRRSFLL